MDRLSQGNPRIPLIVGVAGGSGSGKTTVVQRLLAELGTDRVALLEQDAYYRDRSDLIPAERAGLNYDHPEAIDEGLLAAHVRRLRAGEPVEAPQYDFVAQLRRSETRRIESRSCVVVEGILVLASAELRDLLDLRLYVDTDADLRFIRRLRRDIAERGRTPESVMSQWEATVGPMHAQFVEPSKRHAHLIIPEGGLNAPALEVILGHLRQEVGG
jgi:uridine kinase